MHGIGSRWQMWEPVMGRLAEHHDVIAVDLAGFGASPMPPPGTPAGIDSQITLVSEFLAQLGVDRPHVAGNSMGGLLALEMAARGLVSSATALSPAGFASRTEMTYGARLAVAERPPGAADRPLLRDAVRHGVRPQAGTEPVRRPARAADRRRGRREHPCAGGSAVV